MRGPKRASNIRKLFNLDKEDDLRQMVKKSYRREFEKDGKKHSRCPKIQRLVTPATLQRKRHKRAVRRRRIETVGGRGVGRGGGVWGGKGWCGWGWWGLGEWS